MSQPAFLSAFAVSRDGSSRALTQNALSGGTTADEYIWLHVQSDGDDVAELLATLALSDSISDALCAAQTRPRAMQMEHGVLIYLRGINNNPEADPEDMVSLRIWCGPKLIITARRKGRRLMSVQALQEDVTSGTAPASPTELLLDLVVRLADRIHETVEEIDDALVQFEETLSFSKQDRQQLTSRRRQSAAIRRFLAPQRDTKDKRTVISNDVGKPQVIRKFRREDAPASPAQRQAAPERKPQREVYSRQHNRTPAKPKINQYVQRDRQRSHEPVSRSYRQRNDHTPRHTAKGEKRVRVID